MKFAGGIRAGSAVVASVSTGDGSLSAVVDNINAQKAATGITAASVRVGTSSFRMQVSSMQTGVASKLSINSASLSGAGALLENSMATDAEVTIGSGAGAYSATSSKNSFTDLLPGSNITVLKLGSATVTAAADSNAEGVADLIAKTNTVLSYIAEQSRSSAAASGVLSGDASVRRFAESLRRSVLSTSSTTRAGISVDRSGTLTFNREAYEAAYAADPEGVRNLFAQSASTLAGASFLQATDRTQAGSYNVNVTQVATRAMATVSDWSIPMAFSQGTLKATYTPNPAATPAELAAGLTTFFTNNSFGLAAAVQGGNVAVTASAWGTDGTFRLNTTSYAGNNVTGSIDGVAATGAGRTLYLPTSSTSQAAGLRLTVSATTPGDLGAINYQPGIAGSLRLLAITAGENSSPLRAAKASRETRIKSADSQLAALERRLKAREDQMRRQYSALDSNIGRLNNTSSWLAQQTSQISR
jgi:flagellar hook-associated protein 2